MISIQRPKKKKKILSYKGKFKGNDFRAFDMIINVKSITPSITEILVEY